MGMSVLGTDRVNARPLWAVSLALLVVAATVPDAGAAARPDLKIAKLSGYPETAPVGTRISVSVKVVNAGRSSAAASVARVYLDRDGVRSADDVRAAGEIKVKKLGRGKSVTTRAAITIPDVEPGPYLLLACADDLKRLRETSEKNNCRPSTTAIDVVERTSEALIDAEIRSGSLDEEEGLIFKVFAAFSDFGFRIASK